jgi:hypothetical protein
LARKGRGKEAHLAYAGHALMEHRNGLLVDFQVNQANGTAERDIVPDLIDQARERDFHPRTLAGDKAYDTRQCVADLRARNVTPHVAQNTSRRSAIDRRTTRHAGYGLSQRKRKRVEIVCSQVTKTCVRAGLGRGNDVPDLHRVIGYDHSVDQQLYQFAPLFERSAFESAGQLLEDSGGRSGHRLDRYQLLTLSNHLPLTGEDIFFTPPQLVALVLERRQIQNSGEIRLQQSGLLTAQSQTDCTQAGLTTAQFLRDPVASLSALQLVGDQLRVLYNLAQIFPNKRV